MRTGKIASLSYEVREELCARLRNGQRGTKLMDWLHQFDTTINDQNLTNWRQGGYQDWLKEQAHLDLIRKRSEATRRELEAGGFDVLDKAIYDLACTLSEAELAPDKAAYAITALKSSVIAGKNAELSARKVTIAQEKLDLDRAKYQRDTCELFLKWYADKAASDIASGSGDRTEKIEALGKLIFGEDWSA